MAVILQPDKQMTEPAPAQQPPEQGKTEMFFPAEGPTNPEYEQKEDAQAEATAVNLLITAYENLRASMDARLEMRNIAPSLPANKIAEIEQRVWQDYNLDLGTMAEWREENKKWIDLATMVHEQKTNTAGDKVSSVKYPLLATAIIQFYARAYPEIVKGDTVARFTTVGKDDEKKTKEARSKRVADFTNYQILNQMPDWEEDMALALCMIPAAGVAIKKTYRDGQRKCNHSTLVLPDRFVVNYKARSLEYARRLTEEIDLYRNDIVSRINSGLFIEFDINSLGPPTGKEGDTSASSDLDAAHVFLEQHRWLDLDDDGYEEPYIVTIHRDSQKLVRIAARYDSESVTYADDEKNPEVEGSKKITHIEPTQHYTLFVLMPSPDGGIFGMGLGKILYGINSSVNTSINQLFDAGARKNEPSGLLGRGIQMGRGAGGGISLPRGKFLPVNNSGDELRKNVFQMDTGEPSAVVLSLLDRLLEAGEKASMVSLGIAGDTPGANTPVGTTLARVEEGLKPYSAAFKSIFRSLTKELKKIQRLNRLYLTQQEYMLVLDDPEADKAKDFENKTLDILPVADPTMATDIQRMMKAQALMELKGTGLNDTEINKRYLEALRVDNAEAVIGDGKPNPAAVLAQRLQEVDIALKESQTRLNDVKCGQGEFGKVLDEAKIKLQALAQDHEHFMAKRAADTAEKEVGTAVSDNTPGPIPPKPASSEPPVPDNVASMGLPSRATTQGPFEERGMESDNLNGEK